MTGARAGIHGAQDLDGSRAASLSVCPEAPAVIPEALGYFRVTALV